MPYPVILGGDHAEFEAEWAASGKPDSERPDWPLPSFDARDWAKAFCQRFKVVRRNTRGWKELLFGPRVNDEDLMIGWFANALMRGFDESTSRDASYEAAREREVVALWMMERGYATGHGDTIGDLLIELEGQARGRGTAQDRVILSDGTAI